MPIGDRAQMARLADYFVSRAIERHNEMLIHRTAGRTCPKSFLGYHLIWMADLLKARDNAMYMAQVCDAHAMDRSNT